VDEHGYYIIVGCFYMGYGVGYGVGSGPGFEPFGIRATFVIVTTGHHTILMFVWEDRYDTRDPEERDSHIYIRILVITQAAAKVGTTVTDIGR